MKAAPHPECNPDFDRHYGTHLKHLRLGEGLRLQVADIDAERVRVHVRDAKGSKGRFVPLPVIHRRPYCPDRRAPPIPNRSTTM